MKYNIIPHRFRNRIKALLSLWWERAHHCDITDEFGEARAKEYGLLREYRMARKEGLTPREALEDWDLLYEDEM